MKNRCHLTKLKPHTFDYLPMPTVAQLKAMDPAIRSRILEKFLKENGIREPEAQHIALAEALVFSHKPSATAAFPGGITLGREYGRLTLVKALMPLETVVLSCPGVTELPQLDLRVICQEYDNQEITRDSFTAIPSGTVIVRARKSGDSMRFPGGTKSLKKWMIDEKIPAARRDCIPVIADDRGILGVYGAGGNLDRHTGTEKTMYLRFESTNK